ncbi:hypothetical protein KJ966_25690 [bacterium]|nr:hypothetical protein [bacterium]
MKLFKLVLLTAIINLFFNGVMMAQEQAPSIYLEHSEKCNNSSRLYCVNGSHEAAVNRILLDMKKKGYRITPKLIKTIAHSTPSRVRNPIETTVQ